MYRRSCGCSDSRFYGTCQLFAIVIIIIIRRTVTFSVQRRLNPLPISIWVGPHVPEQRSHRRKILVTYTAATRHLRIITQNMFFFDLYSKPCNFLGLKVRSSVASQSLSADKCFPTKVTDTYIHRKKKRKKKRRK